MKLDFETIRKTFEDPFNGEHAKTLRRNIAEGITKGGEYHAHMVRSSMEMMKKMQDLWLQGLDWYIDTHQKMTNFISERISPEGK